MPLTVGALRAARPAAGAGGGAAPPGARSWGGGPVDVGSVLALAPAGFLVLILLAALAVDSAVAYLGQQQLHDALSAAVNDAVTAGLDNAAFYRSGSLSLDPASVAQTVCASVEAQADSGLHDVSLAVAISGSSVRLIGTATVDAVFGRAIPGFGRRSVSSSAQASLETGPARGPLAAGGAAAGPARPLSCA